MDTKEMKPILDPSSNLSIESTSMASEVAIAASLFNILIITPLLYSIIWYETRIATNRYDTEIISGPRLDSCLVVDTINTAKLGHGDLPYSK